MSAPSNKPAASTNSQAPLAQLFRGTVKQINSADSVVIKSLVVKDGKNLEKTVMIAGINAPRLARRNPNNSDNSNEPDQVRLFRKICFKLKNRNRQFLFQISLFIFSHTHSKLANSCVKSLSEKRSASSRRERRRATPTVVSCISAETQ